MAFATAGALLEPERLDTPGQPAPAVISARLRDEILRGSIPPGDRMRQDAVATRFGVSQNTVREAFKILEADGLLRFEPRRGVSVARLSAAEAWEITELRSLLEVQALGWALPNHTTGSLDAADAVLARLDALGTVDQVISLNASFHRILYAPAERERTLGLVETLRVNFERYLRLTWHETGHLEQSQREHRAILLACRERNRGKAATLLRKHIRETGRLLVERIERFHEKRSPNASPEIADDDHD
jgi:DNA-binding GntR family transcriptional regulator